MSALTRWVVLDNDSPRLQYTGTWEVNSDPKAHLGTVQVTATNGSKMRFEFNGTKIVLNGRATWKDGEPKPTAACTIDGMDIGDGITPGSFTFNCAWSGKEREDSEPRTFGIEVGIPEGSSSAWIQIDSVEYLPSPNSGPLNDTNALVKYEADDPHIYYAGPGIRRQYPGLGDTEIKMGSSATVFFIGTKITWVGWVTLGNSVRNSSVQLWVDSGTPSMFDVGLPGRYKPEPCFTAAGLFWGEAHNVTVAFEGPSNSLILDHFLVQDGNFVVDGEGLNLPSTPTASASATPTPSPSGGVPSAAVVGGVLGGFTLVTLALLAYFLARRRRRRMDKNNDIASPNSTKLPYTAACPPASSSTPDLLIQTPRSARLSTNTTSSTPPNTASGEQARNDPLTLQGREDPDASLVAGPSTTQAMPTTSLQTRGVTTNGDFALAARDVHMHKHTHIYHYGMATEINTQAIHTQADDRHLLDEPH